MTPTKLIIIVISALYVLSPIDAVPDVAPFIGWLDDVVVGSIGALTAIAAVTGKLRRAKEKKDAKQLNE